MAFSTISTMYGFLFLSYRAKLASVPVKLSLASIASFVSIVISTFS